MIALDTETTGLDFRHGTKPFFITTCDSDGEQQHWQWDVDPLTRQPMIPEEDVEQIRRTIETIKGWAKFDNEVRGRHSIVLQNAKFDVTALHFIGVRDWPWEMTQDTLVAGHVLASNQPHNLTDLAMDYLGVDIEVHEKKLKEVVEKARRLVQQARLKGKRGGVAGPLADWKIAEKHGDDMPSADKTVWRADLWLPRAMHKVSKSIRDEHPEWGTVLEEYANADSAVTLALWHEMERKLHERGLWAIYRAKMATLPVLFDMEMSGVTMSKKRLTELRARFVEESEAAGRKCVNIAKSLGCGLDLPSSGNNGSLLRFCFGDKYDPAASSQEGLRLPVLKSTKGGKPSLDKEAIDLLEVNLPERSKQLSFVKALQGKRKRDKAVDMMATYERFMVPLGGNEDWFRIHCSFNPVGTDTTRLSSSNPNGQNVSKQGDYTLRHLFGPAPGREWWSLDYENIELRIPSYESGEQSLIELFEHPDDPPYFGSQHLLVCHLLHPKLFDERVCPECFGKGCKERRGCQKERVPLSSIKEGFKTRYKDSWYQWVKNGNFAVQYGCQEAKADATYRVKGAFKKIKSHFAKQDALVRRMMAMAEKLGYVETMPDKTVNPKRGYPLLVARTEWGKVLPTTPLSYHVQGTAGWCMNKAMVRCHEHINQWRESTKFDGFIALTVHDELVFDFPKVGDPTKDHAREKQRTSVFPNVKAQFRTSNLWRIRKMQRMMEMSGDDIGVPLKVAVTYNPETWSKGVSL